MRIPLSWRIALFAAIPLACTTTARKKEAIKEEQSAELSIPDPKPLDEYFSARFSPSAPGGAVLVMIGDSIIFSKGYGLSDLNTKESVTPNTLFNIGSVSKTFVSNAILILNRADELSLADNLTTYFPDFVDKKIAAKVQIKHLLTHTSGLPDIRYPWKDSVFYLTAKDKENWAPIQKVKKLNFEPGSNYEYSNPAFNALALIIEQVSGVKWQQYVREKIMIPSGMNTSTITDGPHPSTGVAHGYIWVNNQWSEKDYGEEPTFAAAGNGGVWSSVVELARYELAMRNYVFLDSTALADAFQVKSFPNWKSEDPATRGWAWSIGKTRQGYKTVGHDGFQGGFRAFFISIPEKKWFVVILTGAPHPLDEYKERVLDFLQTGK
jgi:CubicO group peptidase (beta-lactamase class C family)